MLSRVGKTRPDQGRGVLLARIVGKAGSKQGYPVGMNCCQERIRTVVHSGTQWARIVGMAGSEQG